MSACLPSSNHRKGSFRSTGPSRPYLLSSVWTHLGKLRRAIPWLRSQPPSYTPRLGWTGGAGPQRTFFSLLSRRAGCAGVEMLRVPKQQRPPRAALVSGTVKCIGKPWRRAPAPLRLGSRPRSTDGRSGAVRGGHPPGHGRRLHHRFVSLSLPGKPSFPNPEGPRRPGRPLPPQGRPSSFDWRERVCSRRHLGPQKTAPSHRQEMVNLIFGQTVSGKGF